MKLKNQVLKEFDSFRASMDTQQGKKIKSLQTDNGLEYVNQDFEELLRKYGILRRLTAPYNPEQNGTAERRNRTLMDTARCLVIQSGLPAYLWAEAVNTANFIRNRCRTRKLQGKTPYELWFGNAPNVSNLKRFGCEVFIMERSPGRSKLQPRSRRGVFVGYSTETKGYRSFPIEHSWLRFPYWKPCQVINRKIGCTPLQAKSGQYSGIRHGN